MTKTQNFASPRSFVAPLLVLTLHSLFSFFIPVFASAIPRAIAYPTIIYTPISEKELERQEEAWRQTKKAFTSFFFPTRQEAQARLTLSLQENANILKWATYISCGLIVVSGALWLYEKHLKEGEARQIPYGQAGHKEHQRSSMESFFHNIDGPNLKKPLVFSAAVIFFGALFAQSWRIGKLKELALKS